MPPIWSGLRKLLRQKRVVVLMYHRVADLDTDPWQLAVSPKNFEAQIALLKKKFNVITINELAHQLQRGCISKDSICITFDDGYKDNYEIAKPILEKHNCPATFFIASHFLEKQLPYWWDELEHLLMHTSQLPSTLTIKINEEEVYISLKEEVWLTPEHEEKHKTWVWPEPPPTQRCNAYLAIWEKLKPLPYNQIEFILQKLKEWAFTTHPFSVANMPMTLQQLQDLNRNPLFTIGLHTVSHPALSFHSRNFQFGEIYKNKEELEKLLHLSISHLSYPNGLYNSDTLEIADELNIKTAYTTKEKLVTIESNPLKLGRSQVINTDIQTFKNKLLHLFK